MYIANKDGSSGIYVNNWTYIYTCMPGGQHRYQLIINQNTTVATTVDRDNKVALTIFKSILNPFVDAIKNGDNLFICESWK